MRRMAGSHRATRSARALLGLLLGACFRVCEEALTTHSPAAVTVYAGSRHLERPYREGAPLPH